MDNRSRYNKNEVLSEANKLAGAGLRQAALDLLLEYAEEDAETPQVLAAIGRLYLLEKNYPKSVVYLQKSLNLEKLARSRVAGIDGYAEDFSEDDLAFVENQPQDAGAQLNETALSDDGVSIPHPQESSLEDELPLRSEPNEETPADLEEAEHEYKDKTQPGEMVVESVVDEEYEDSISDEIGVIPEDQYGPLNAFADDDSLDEVIEREIAGLEELEQADPAPAQEDLLDEEFYLEVTQVADSDEAFELDWDDIDDLDGYTEETTRPAPEKVVGKGKLTREARSMQVAIEVLDRHDLGNEHLPLLQLIFFENGWSAARVAIERELTRGTLPVELGIAREIRHFWWQSERYWTTFRGLYFNAMNLQAEATYRQMSWPEALRIAACFPGLPSIEEVEDLIEETFLLWYESRRLLRAFPVFFKFLKYRTGSMAGTLSRSEPRCFHEYQDDGVEDSLGGLDGNEEELRQQLWEFGVDIYKVREYDKRLLQHPEEIPE